MAPASTCLRSCWRQTFRAYDVKMMWLSTRLTILETITASHVVAIQWFIKMYILRWRLTLSLQISHGSAGIFCTVLLNVPSRTCLPIFFIESGSHLTNTEHKISWQFSPETRCRFDVWVLRVILFMLTFSGWRGLLCLYLYSVIAVYFSSVEMLLWCYMERKCAKTFGTVLVLNSGYKRFAQIFIIKI